MYGYFKKYPLSYVFMIGTFVYGLGFVTAQWWLPAQKSSLYAALLEIDNSTPIIWGVIAMLATITMVVSDVVKNRSLARSLCNAGLTLGILVWIFATIVYMMNGFWLTAFTVSIEYLAFWCWVYFMNFVYREK